MCQFLDSLLAGSISQIELESLYQDQMKGSIRMIEPAEAAILCFDILKSPIAPVATRLDQSLRTEPAPGPKSFFQ